MSAVPARGKLGAALSAVDWNANVATFLAIPQVDDRVTAATMTLALWARQLETYYKKNPALSFIREMQTCGHHTAAMLALGLYKPAAASIRTILESALYFSYFLSHPAELATLVRDVRYYATKHEILEFHKSHTVEFVARQSAVGLVSMFDDVYGRLSAIVHGQVPGKWSGHTALNEIKCSPDLCMQVISELERCVATVNYLFLCTIAHDIWGQVPRPVKVVLLRGLAREKREVLGLDLA